MMITSSYQLAERAHGVCHGTVWRQMGATTLSGSGLGFGLVVGGGGGASAATADTGQISNYCVLTGVRFRCYESEYAWERGDVPVVALKIVGASAWKPLTASSAASLSDTSFRLVSDQGTHVYCQAPTAVCRDVWLSALHAGLEQSLLHSDDDEMISAMASMSTAAAAQKGNKKADSSARRILSAAPQRGVAIRRSLGSFNRYQRNRKKICASCGAEEALPSKPILIGATPFPQVQACKKEQRTDSCIHCLNAQGLLEHLEYVLDLHVSARQELEALRTARALFADAIEATTATAATAAATANTPTTKSGESTSETTTSTSQPTKEQSVGGTDSAVASTEAQVEEATSAAATSREEDEEVSEPEAEPAPTKLEPGGSNSSNSSGGSSSAESWTHVKEDGDHSKGSDTTTSGGSSGTTATGSWMAVEPPRQPQQSWIHLPPTQASTKAMLGILQDAYKFGGLARSSPILETLSQQVLNGTIGVVEFLEQLDEAAGTQGAKYESMMALKKQAFRVAGDMGTAMKLLLDHALPVREKSSSNNDIEMLSCILDFFLDLCEENELSSVALFWPQFCHIHLRMLPPQNAKALARVELMEDFLLTVACRYSIHLALELMWSHTADLEDSLLSPSSTDGSGGASGTPPTCNAACRRRRFAVMRFVCELESLLFEFEDGWGGGTVSLGKMLSPSREHTGMLKATVRSIQKFRKTSPNRLSRSFRLERLAGLMQDKPPEEVAAEKLRMANNADYFSSHLNFTRRICDIAEKLRFMEVEDRADALEAELNLLNSSGALGGDPLNNIRDDLVRVVRVPNREGHVFRSKERTPVLLLMEVIDEGAEKVLLSQERLAELKQPSRDGDEVPSPPPILVRSDGEGQTSGFGSAEGEEIVPASQKLPKEEPVAVSAVRTSVRIQLPPDASDAAVPPPPPAAQEEDILEGATTGVKPSPRRKFYPVHAVSIYIHFSFTH